MTAQPLAGGLIRLIQRLYSDRQALAAVEFAITAPFILTLFLAGTEVTNYTITKMRISQLAVHVADSGSRIGTASLLSNPKITETQINDLLTGAELQAGSLELFQNGRVIISSLEPVANPNTTNKFKIRWQRCKGSKSWLSSYGLQGATNLPGMGPLNGMVTAPDSGAIIFVEIAYNYQPIVAGSFAPGTVIKDVAAMMVRDERDYSGNNGVGIYNTENAAIASCA